MLHKPLFKMEFIVLTKDLSENCSQQNNNK